MPNGKYQQFPQKHSTLLKITSRYVDILKGRDGRDGLNGRDGLAGSIGEKGDKGEPGQNAIQGPPGPSSGGAIYTRWGRTVCPDTSGTELVYKGLTAGTPYDQTGGGANYLCAATDPQYFSTQVPRNGANEIPLSYLSGTQYKVPSFSSLHYHNVPCAVCYTSQRSSKLMIPGRRSCPQSWTEEYEGYLMAEHSNPGHKHTMVYECVDIKDGEVVPDEGHDSGGALFYLTGAVCNVGLPCPPYEANRPMTCVVCTK